MNKLFCRHCNWIKRISFSPVRVHRDTESVHQKHQAGIWRYSVALGAVWLEVRRQKISAKLSADLPSAGGGSSDLVRLSTQSRTSCFVSRWPGRASGERCPPRRYSILCRAARTSEIQ